MIDISPVNVPKAGEVLANLLREKILDGEIAEATNLPNERELTEQTGLSRASVREALRILEGEGLIVKRLGRNVAPPSSAQPVRLSSARLVYLSAVRASGWMLSFKLGRRLSPHRRIWQRNFTRRKISKSSNFSIRNWSGLPPKKI